MNVLSHTIKRSTGIEVLDVTFEGCDFHVRGDIEMSVDLPNGRFTGVVSGFNIERVSRTEIQTNITIIRSSAWGRIRNMFVKNSTQSENSI